MTTSIETLQQKLTAYGKELDWMEIFKYLGILVSFDDNDVQTQVMRSSLMKAYQSWARISCVLQAENASPCVCSLFYKATVQAGLLFGSESWNISLSAIKCLEGFHLRAAC